jgi:hypothetical protein
MARGDTAQNAGCGEQKAGGLQHRAGGREPESVGTPTGCWRKRASAKPIERCGVAAKYDAKNQDATPTCTSSRSIASMLPAASPARAAGSVARVIRNGP